MWIKNGSVAILASKRLAGIVAEVNLYNPLNADKETFKQGIWSAFETQGRHRQKSKTVAPQKGLYPIQILKKSLLKTMTFNLEIFVID